MKGMEERRDTNLQKLVKRAMGDDQSSVSNPQSTVHSRQFEAPAQAESRTRSVGTTAHSRQFETPASVGSLQSSVFSRQFESPTHAESRTRSVGEEAQSRTRSVGTAVGESEAGQAARQKTQGRKGKGGFFKGLISGTLISESLILKDMKYSALIAVLAIIFISNKFSAERVERQIIVLEQEVRDMRAESLSVSADLGSVSRQSEITDLVKERGLGLEELREPPYRIVVNE